MTIHVSAGSAVWHGTGNTGVTFAVLRRHGDGEDSGATLMTRFSAGTAGGWHTHPGGEELYVIRGRCRLNGLDLRAGDYVYTPVGEAHELVAIDDTEVLVVLPKRPLYQQRPWENVG